MTARRRETGLLAALLLLAALQLVAFHWGVVMPDTVEQYRQALTAQYDDWHPPVTAALWRLIMRVHQGTGGILLFDIALYWSGIGLIARRLLRDGRTAAAILIVAVAMLPIPFGQMGAILKDPLLAALCVLVTGIIMNDGQHHPIGRAIALVALVIATATRFNALFATLPLLLALAPVASLATWPRRIIVTTAGAATLVASSWLINVAILQPHRSEPIFSLVNFDLGGIAAFGGSNPYPSMNDVESARLTRLCYDPGHYNPSYLPACNEVENGLAEYAHHHHVAATRLWITAISRAPISYLRHRIAHLNLNWRFLVPNVPLDAVYLMSQPNDLGIRFVPNPLTRAIVAAAQWMAWSPLGRPATWLAVALALLAISDVLPSRRAIRALACSALAYGFGYALVSVATDMRYNLWTMMAAMIAAVLALGDILAGGVSLPKARLIAGAAFVTLVVAGEVLCLAL